ncbi:protein ALTERED SEED GERMINATION 2 [Beta vulgaris subsp. vulgaris]|uniref:protein ALTERED SEED GERMINATION 2 n=1 Tax=Beta vulgaris subsp. vulgaris TaxID=3555 RepID=UPI002037555E|nr:protein ALTERED SEED GERMINATION 2 [Beta vulgaris subsp. vulgaris]XP_048497782.1 protein ALTERED SEED GERMINATION 2 [Beta vulgaris subsp. vulgaris]XP_048497787.1 protein ALTERED SEED GERMINATION 2 [Beta vulgaris subsp. vulgaris]
MDSFAYHDANISNLIENRTITYRHDGKHTLHMHSSMVRRLALERELEGHIGCVNTIAWNSIGSLLISGSDDTRINIWRYSDRKLLNCIDTGHSSNIFCTKFIPETSDEIVASGAGDAEVRIFNTSCLSEGRVEETAVVPCAHFQCHNRRVKKLAVEVGNPNVIWSASEDGTLRQHDLRESSSCPRPGSSNQECRSVLLDLRGAAKRSLMEPPKQLLQLKSCDISVTRPHLLLVGGSDAFARLYDRRMLPPMSSCRRKNSPPPCVNYFCPMHLSERGRSSLHLTHVTFSPNGEEILMSYSGEHVYLMDLKQGGGNSVQYTCGDVENRWSFSPFPNAVELSSLGAVASENFSAKSNAGVQNGKCTKLVEMAEKCLEVGTQYYSGIEACNEVLDGGHKIDPLLKHDCLCARAALLLKRKWKNDAHMAVRDLNQARKINSSSFKSHFCMSEALSQLGKHKGALDFALAAQCLDPSNAEVAERVEIIRKQLSAAEAEKNKKLNDTGSKSEPRAGRVISLSDILYRSGANSDASQDGPRSERDDSDYDEELELDFETSMSGDEGRDAESNVLHGSLNLRMHRRADSAKEAGGSNSTCGSPSSCQNDKTIYQPEAVIDMKQRYVGHCNVGTDIKQASFLGQNGDYIASGSDGGRWFIWEKKTGRLVKMLLGDKAVVNCVQCHPFDSVVATSGIDSTVKIWTPSASVPSMVAGGSAGPDTANVLEVMEGNQHRLCETHEAILPLELLERFRMHDFTEGTLHPFECAQS